MKNNKITLFIGIGLLVLILLIGGVFVLSKKSSNSSSNGNGEQEVKAKKLNADDIGLTFTPSSDKRTITMEITKTDGVKSIEYEASYERDVDDPSSDGEGRVTDGLAPSTIDLKETDTTIKRDILLGTCSKNVCRYHKGVKEVDFVIKVNYKSGEVGEIDSKVTL